MNEHDSERISGLLQTDGMEAVEDVAEANVIVLNTCCIRENADNKPYGTLGHLKTWKAAREVLDIFPETHYVEVISLLTGDFSDQD